MATDKTYYEWLYTIDGTGNPTGPVVVFGEMVFEAPSDAVKYMLTFYPETKPEKGIIERNPKLVRELALKYRVETQFLLRSVERMLDQSRAKANAKWVEVECQPNDLLGNVNRSVGREEALRLGGISSGLSEVWQRLHSRYYELDRISREALK